jgi:cation:H+ antiporter|tara:strand:- start:593 stop:1630 length:1038 start_codon:yes stop_codon:yes gene_type:complete
MGIIIPILLIAFISYLLWRSCENFERYSKVVGYNLTDGVRGATINAIGSSLPELFVSFFFLFIMKDVIGFSAGIATILGSAVFNILIIPALIIPVLIKGNHEIKIKKKLIFRDAGTLIISQIALLYFIQDGVISLIDGFYLFLIYLSYLLILGKGRFLKRTVNRTKSKKKQSIWFKLIINVVYISVLCLLLVKLCEVVSGGAYPVYYPFSEHLSGMGMDIMLVAVFIAAAASSIPDLFISYVDASKGEVDDSLANPLASNLFDICVSFGLPLFLYTLFYGDIDLMNSLNPDVFSQIYSIIILMIFITVLFLISVMISKKYTIYHSVFFILLYIGFIYRVINLLFI